MKSEFWEPVVRRRNEERAARNEELKTRLARGKSFEEMLAELASLKGFNKGERERTSA